MHIERFLKNIDTANISQDDAVKMFNVLRRVQDEIMYAPVARSIRGEGQLDVKESIERITREEFTSRETQ